ncbi:uncharacterized protein LOC142350732 isoform X3 [Convolutriloba macropyga]|uniref:uncharacterized protein LOC142350732 isoform X3 n=1 Tax=Convolutriloba macropyga TaxID=536237 RepID=UPI003F51ACEF
MSYYPLQAVAESSSENNFDKSKLKKSDSMGEREGGSTEDLPADLAALKVTMDKLEQVRKEIVIPEKEPVPPAVNVKMRKLKPAAERYKQSVLVAKVADPDAPVRQPSQVQKAGRPQYGLDGHFLTHSILGEENDFYREQERRAAEENAVRPPGRHKIEAMTASQRDMKMTNKAMSTANNRTSQDAAAINHWHDWMQERNEYRSFLGNRVDRPHEDLLMNIGDMYREKKEVLQQIDRNLAFIDYGKGYRVGSEFWAQPQWVGSEETGIQFTLTSSQKGYPPVYEHTGIPHDIQMEKGYVHIPPGRRGWQDSEFLAKRMRQLQQIIHEVDPKKPSQQDFDELMIRGQNSDTIAQKASTDKPQRAGALSHKGNLDARVSTGGHVQLIAMESPRTENLPDDFYEQHDQENVDAKSVNIMSPDPNKQSKSRGGSTRYVTGPALKIGGVTAAWEGNDTSRVGEIGAACRVIFDGNQGDQVTSWLEVINYGSTVVKFNWTREKRYNPFDKPTDVLQQRFYFNTGPSVILPRQKLLFPFVFKSDCAGIFSENWQMNTTPKLCGGAKIIVTLKGVALMVDKYKEVREEISDMLAKRTAATISKNFLLNIVDALHTSRPPPTPIDALLTDEEKFERLNPGLTGGVNEKLVDLTNFYKDLFPEEEREEVVWDLDLNTIREKVLEMEDEKQREKTFKKFNEMVYKLTTPIDRPTVNEELYHLVYSHVSRICDGIVSSSMALKSSLGLSESELILPAETNDKPLGYAIKQRELFIVEQREEQKRRQKALEGADKGKDAKKGGGGKDKGKDADSLLPPSVGTGSDSVSPGGTLIVQDTYRAKDAAGRRASWVASPRISSAGSIEKGCRALDPNDILVSDLGKFDASLGRPKTAPSEGNTPTDMDGNAQNQSEILPDSTKKKVDKKSKKEKGKRLHGGGKDSKAANKAGGGAGGKDRPGSKGGSPKKEETKSSKKLSATSGSNLANESQTDVLNETNAALVDDAGSKLPSDSNAQPNNLNINIENSSGNIADAGSGNVLEGVISSNAVIMSGIQSQDVNILSATGADIFVNDPDSDKFVSMMDMSRTATSIELEEPAEDDTLYSKYRERLHVMVRDMIGDNLVELLLAYDDVKMRNPWKPNLPVG